MVGDNVNAIYVTNQIPMVKDNKLNKHAYINMHI